MVRSIVGWFKNLLTGEWREPSPDRKPEPQEDGRRFPEWTETIPLDTGPIPIDQIHAGSRIELPMQDYTSEQIKQYVMAISFRTGLPCGAEIDDDKDVWVITTMAVPSRPE